METRLHSTTRFCPSLIETRDGRMPDITGYAAVFYKPGVPGTEYSLGTNIKERISRGAFDRSLREGQDTRCLLNHNPNFLLGRVGNGTLRLRTDDIGLHFTVTPPDTTAGRDAVESVRRGDLTGASIGFKAQRDQWIRGGKVDLRVIEDADLYDLGPVVFPAYKATSAGLRSAAKVPARHAPQKWDKVSIRLRMLELDDDDFLRATDPVLQRLLRAQDQFERDQRRFFAEKIALLKRSY